MRKTATRQTLNDPGRLRYWQESIGGFSLTVPVPEISEALADYLQCYKLHSAVEASVRYHAGFETLCGEPVFQQFFDQGPGSELVLIVHGYTDHAGIFSKIINHLVASGRSVLTFDQPGHGLSGGERASIEHFDCYLELLENRFDSYQSSLGRPLHILAQSLGGAIVMDWLLEEKPGPERLGAIVLLAPLVRPRAWWQALLSTQLLSKVFDSFPRGESRNSEDRAFTHFVRHVDPVQHHRMPVQWVKAMVAWVRRFESKPGGDWPLWVIQGDNDQTVDWRYNLKHIQQKFPNTRVRMIVGAGHHLAGESERVQSYLFEFIEEAFTSQDGHKKTGPVQ